MQVTFILEHRLQNKTFYQNMIISLPTDAYIFNRFEDGNVKSFTLNSLKIKKQLVSKGTSSWKLNFKSTFFVYIQPFFQ